MQPNSIILASKSPRRQYLLKEIGVDFLVKTKELAEDFPEHLQAEQIPLYLCELKANSFNEELRQPNTMLIAADTIVWVNGKVLNKPENAAEAAEMLQTLSGNVHQVFTGVCLKSNFKKETFFVESKVYFNVLKPSQIEAYISQCRPFDKAGSYGAQECLPQNFNPCSKEEIDFLKTLKKSNLIENSIRKTNDSMSFDFVKKIDGSYFNVMGLPIVELFQKINNFFSN